MNDSYSYYHYCTDINLILLATCIRKCFVERQMRDPFLKTEMRLESTELQAAIHIFRLLEQRNKNQHRHSKWWKWFALLKRCVSKLIHESRARDNLLVQARLKYMNQFLLPRCHSSFTQLIQDTQFSTLGLTLFAELSRIRSLVVPCNDQVSLNKDPGVESVKSRNIFSSTMSEDIGEFVSRTRSENHTNVATLRVLAFDLVTESGRVAERGLHEEDGAGLGVAKTANGEIEVPSSRAHASTIDAMSYASSEPAKRKKQRKSTNAIDALFQGLD